MTINSEMGYIIRAFR